MPLLSVRTRLFLMMVLQFSIWGAWLPLIFGYLPSLGFTPLPWLFFAALIALAVGYLVLVEVTKKVFYAEPMQVAGQPLRTRGQAHRIHRRAARFSHPGPLPSGPTKAAT